jgi:serine phosphatase RsbU (regulator of sigma subunit)
MKKPGFLKRWLRPGAAGAGLREESRYESGLLTGDPRIDEHSLQVLLGSIADITSSMEVDAVLEDIVDKSLQVTQAERGILLLGAASEDLQIRVARDRDGAALGGELQYSTSVVGKALTEMAPTRAVVQSDQEALELGRSVFDLKLRAVMCAPLIARERLVGAIYVDSRAARREFSSRDLALFGALSAQLAIAVENARLRADSLQKARLQRDVEIAQRIQQHLLAAPPKDIPGLDVALRYHPCSGASGDTYDLMPLPGGRFAALVGDVTGHGIGAALLTHAAQAALRSYLELIDDLSEVITRLNNRLVAGVESGNFMSLALAVIDVPRRTLHYVNAGHPPMLLARQGGVEVLTKTGMVLGVVGDTQYAVRGPIGLEHGDTLLCVTDGVVESMDTAREVFGEQRLQQSLEAARGNPADAVLAAVEAACGKHRDGRPAEDDITMVAIRLAGG